MDGNVDVGATQRRVCLITDQTSYGWVGLLQSGRRRVELLVTGDTCNFVAGKR